MFKVEGFFTIFSWVFLVNYQEDPNKTILSKIENQSKASLLSGSLVEFKLRDPGFNFRPCSIRTQKGIHAANG